MRTLFENYKRFRNYRDCLLFEGKRGTFFPKKVGASLSPPELAGLRGVIRTGNTLLMETATPYGEPLLTVISPVTEHISFLVRLDPRERLAPLLSTWPQEKKHFQFLLVSQREGRLLPLNRPLAEAESLLLPLETIKKEGWFKARDREGQPLLAAVFPVPHSSWYLITWAREVDIIGEEREKISLIIGAFALFLLASTGLMGVIWQRNEKRHYRAHYEELAARFEMEERYRVTLKSIGDGVIVTDPEGKITLMNDVAQTMTGWKEEEALGHPVHEVFNIVNEYSREPVENPILNVLKKGKVVGLANHTLLIARDGKEYPHCRLRCSHKK